MSQTLIRLSTAPTEVFEQVAGGPGQSMLLINRTAALRKEIAALEDQAARKRAELVNLQRNVPAISALTVEIVR
jgi:hypothetical protein